MALRILTIVGARPQFIKASVVTDELKLRDNVRQILVHTGQHHDSNMSQVFFDELDIPEPDVNLGISGGSHAEMTARMLVALEGLMKSEAPDRVLLYGDTNSTLAGALAAAKIHIPVVHVEAGTRTRNMDNPEEVNRGCTDHLSSYLLASTQKNLENLVAEGLGKKSLFVGDPMLDAFVKYSRLATQPTLTSLATARLLPLPDKYYYLTCHREENTADPQILGGILDTLDSLPIPSVYPVHPRNKQAVIDLIGKRSLSNILFVEPVGYLESVYLVRHADQVITDSGGLQREAFFAQKKCVTVLDFQVWPETMVGNRNVLAKPYAESLREALAAEQVIDASYKPFGDGKASVNIVDALMGEYRGI